MPLHIHLFHHFDEKVTDLMSNLSDQLARTTAFIASLQADNAKLTAANTDLTNQLAAAQAGLATEDAKEDDVDAAALAQVLDTAGAPPVPAATEVGTQSDGQPAVTLSPSEAANGAANPPG